MRILVVTETVPYPLDTGGRIKTFHTLQALARDHEVHCHAFARTKAQRDAALPALQAICASVELHVVPRGLPREVGFLAHSLVTGMPFTVRRHFDAAANARIVQACREHRVDAVYCDHLSMFEYAARTGRPIVHDAHNVEYRIVQRFAHVLGLDPRRLLYEREWRRLRAYEAAMYRRAALIFAVSEIDAVDIRAMAGEGVPVVAVPIPVDVSGVAPIAPLTDAPEVLFLGTLDWPPNGDAVDFFLREVWPLVRRDVPTARFTVVGRGGAGLERQWAGTAGVEFTGWVPDIEPWIRRSRLMVVPIRSGSGMRVKILDAFARGLPVVATSVGVEGIEAIPGTHLEVADDAADLARATIALLGDGDRARACATAARALALARYDTPAVGAQQNAAIARFVVAAGADDATKGGVERDFSSAPV
jgi:glycosyltransferase involved in cell wall biosynthesis